MDRSSASEEDIFLGAVEIDDLDRRRAFLDGACGNNSSLRAAVDALLAAHQVEGDALDSQDAPGNTTDWSVADPQGREIGPYKLLQEIGQGGFGVVYMAEQQRPVRRHVALKVIKLGMDTRQVIARFEAERQALALMDHPNIAKVLDAGSTAGGRPYFVMELVKGVPITEFCDKNALTPRQRLELFSDVCRAVQHAHQKGIIHRDLKPSNILVTLHDGKPVPKVIDFGVSKALVQRLTEKTLFTRFGQAVGTPQYMSPEQAEMSGLDIDTRSDVYSLGVVLYELLTGTTPLELETLRDAGFAEMVRLIQDQEPPRPSVRLSTLNERLSIVSKHRGITDKQLGQQVRGDLDWIVMKALEKDRSRRYETASALADDVHRHLRDEPVLAGPPTFSYRLRKFIRRKRGLAVTAAAILFAIVCGLVLATVGFVEASRGRRAAETARLGAEQERDRAEAESQRARLAIGILNELLATANAGTGKAADYTVRQQLDDFSVGLDQRLAGQPLVEATIRLTIGDAYASLWELDKAQSSYERAKTCFEQELGAQSPEYATALVKLAATQNKLLRTSADIGDVDAVITSLQDAIAIYQRNGIDDERAALATRVLAHTIYALEGDLVAAEPLFRKALSILDRHASEASTLLRASLQADLTELVFEDPRREREAYELASSSVELFRRSEKVDNVEFGWALNRLGICKARRREYDEAEAILRESMERFASQFGYFSIGEADALRQLVNVLIARFRTSEGVDVCRRLAARAYDGKSSEAAPFFAMAQWYLSTTRCDTESALRVLQNYKAREREFKSLSLFRLIVDVTLCEATINHEGSSPETQKNIDALLPPLEALLNAEAEPSADLIRFYTFSILHCSSPSNENMDRAIVLASKLIDQTPDAPERCGPMLRAARLYRRQGDLTRAMQLLDQCRHVSSGRFFVDLQACDERIGILRSQGSEAEIERAHRDLLARWKAECPPGQAAVSLAHIRLANYLVDQKQFTEAETLLSEAAHDLAESRDDAPFYRRRLYSARIALAEANGDSKAVKEWEGKLRELESLEMQGL